MLDFFRRHKLSFYAVFLGFVFFVLGFLTFFSFFRHPAEKKSEIPKNYDLRFVNADILNGNPRVIDKADYVVLKNEIASYIGNQQKTGIASEVAMYFRDLKNGPTFGIKEQSKFVPASLLKLPTAFVFFDLEEAEPGFIQKQIVFKSTTSNDYIPTFPSAVSPKENQPISIETLLRYMIVYSDNISYEGLVEYLNGLPDGSEKIMQTFQELGIIDPSSDTKDTLTVRGYASLFRLLYNISYLNTEHSEKLLSWLVQSDFTAGLVAGVPKGILVAHKFGERAVENANDKQLHDCGIIYYPGNPYLLCVMTKGDDINKLSEVIKTISSMVYKEVDSRRLEK